MISGEPVQTFSIEETKVYEIIRVDFESNWGDHYHTSVYRIRIHGKPKTAD